MRTLLTWQTEMRALAELKAWKDFFMCLFGSLRWGFFLCSTLTIFGCASTQSGVNSLDELTTSTDNNGITSKPVNLNYPLQTRFLAVNGLLPVSGPGSACLASSKRPSSAIICYSDSGNTEVAYRHYKTDAELTDLIEIQEDLQELQIKVVKLVQADVAAADDPLIQSQARASAAQEITQSVTEISINAQKKNVFLFRWQNNKAGGGGSGVGDFFSGAASGNSSQSGVVIVGGLVLSQLLVGKDDYKTAFDGYSKSTKIATLSMGAEHLVYFADANLSAAITAKLDGTSDEILKELSPSTKIALEAFASLGRAQENQGMFSAVKLEQMSLLEYQGNRPAEQIFYSTLTDVEKLLEALND